MSGPRILMLSMYDNEQYVLTAREDEVLKPIAEGHPSKSIATLTHHQPQTGEHHRANILQKLGMHDRADLTRYAIKAGLVER